MPNFWRWPKKVYHAMASKRHVITAKAYDKKGKLLAEATNNYFRTHPIQAHFAKLAGQPERVYLHAEIAALLGCRDKKPYKLVISRNKADGTAALAAPCPVCVKAIHAWGVSKVEWSV